MINIDTLYAASTPLLGLATAIISVFTFGDPQIPSNIGGIDASPITLIVSLIGTFLLGLMRITNSVKVVEDTNKEILTTLKTLLETNNKVSNTQSELLKLYADDAKKQDRLLEIEIENKDLANRTLTTMSKIVNTNNNNKKDTKKSGNSGTNYPISR